MPPLVAVAVNVVLWPLQRLLPALDVMLTAGIILLPAVTVIALDVTVGVETQLASDVSLTVIAGEPVSVVVEYADAVAPEIAVLPLYH